MNIRLRSLTAAAIATDVALAVQDFGTGLVAGLIVCLALVVAFSKAPGAMFAVALVIAALLQTGMVVPSAVPGVAQVTEATAAAKQWSDRRTNAASCAYRQLAGLAPDDAARLGLVERDCPAGP